MKGLAFIVILCCNFLHAQKVDIFSDEFIKFKLLEMSKESESMIVFNYTPEFKHILKELIGIGWLENAVKISDYYFPLFESKLKKYGLPNDLKYLPVLESGLNPRAKSKVGASGLWQFMEATGAMMGLKSNSYVNLYYCPVANTDSACRYLKNLYDEYGDWKLVLSSYNYGKGNINRKIAQRGSKKYKDIYPYLPKETRAYVPKFLVIKYLVMYRDIYFSGKKQFKYVFTDLKQIKVDKETTVNKVAIKYNRKEGFIRFANPQLLTDIIPKGTIIYI